MTDADESDSLVFDPDNDTHRILIVLLLILSLWAMVALTVLAP